MTRDILDGQGNVMGQLTLPDETSEDQWTAALAVYSYVPPAPPVPTMEQVISAKLKAAMDFGVTMIVAAGTENVLQGISQAGKTKEVSDFLAELGRYLREGSLYAAIAEIDRLTSEEIPAEITTWVTNEKLAAAKGRIQVFLGIS